MASGPASMDAFTRMSIKRAIVSAPVVPKPHPSSWFCFAISSALFTTLLGLSCVHLSNATFFVMCDPESPCSTMSRYHFSSLLFWMAPTTSQTRVLMLSFKILRSPLGGLSKSESICHGIQGSHKEQTMFDVIERSASRLKAFQKYFTVTHPEQNIGYWLALDGHYSPFSHIPYLATVLGVASQEIFIVSFLLSTSPPYVALHASPIAAVMSAGYPPKQETQRSVKRGSPALQDAEAVACCTYIRSCATSL